MTQSCWLCLRRLKILGFVLKGVSRLSYKAGSNIVYFFNRTPPSIETNTVAALSSS